MLCLLYFSVTGRTKFINTIIHEVIWYFPVSFMSHFIYVIHLIYWLRFIIEIIADIRSVCTELGFQAVQEIFCWAQTECICIPCAHVSAGTYQIVQGSFFFLVSQIKKKKKSLGVEWFLDEGVNLLQIPWHDRANSLKVFPKGTQNLI